MRTKVCFKCTGQTFGGCDYYGCGVQIQSASKNAKNSNKNKKERPARTSTPISDNEKHLTSSSTDFSDSVSEFFYQSWKIGLHSKNAKKYRRQKPHTNQWHQPHPTQQYCTPLWYTSYIVYGNVVYQYLPQPAFCTQQTGYVCNGTYLLQPVYLPYAYNYYSN